MALDTRSLVIFVLACVRFGCPRTRVRRKAIPILPRTFLSCAPRSAMRKLKSSIDHRSRTDRPRGQRHVDEGLVEQSRELNLWPRLAHSWDVTEDAYLAVPLPERQLLMAPGPLSTKSAGWRFAPHVRALASRWARGHLQAASLGPARRARSSGLLWSTTLKGKKSRSKWR